jgi:TonB family protein
MSNTPQGAESPLTIGDRRLCVRRPVPSLAYVDLGENNGGIILNIGEGGLAATSAAPLDTDGLARMRFQMPGSSDRLEASGEIAWIGESKRQAGLRFVDLSEDARNRIRNWISLEESSNQSQRETAKVSVEKEQPSGPPPTRTVKSAIAEFAEPDAVAHDEVPGSMLAAETDARSRGAEGFVASRVPHKERVVPDNRDPLQHPDRRVHVRRPVPSLAYVDMGENNGGIILNIGEDGLATTSAAPLDTDGLARMHFQLPGSSDWLEVSGEIAWISESKREAGLRFVDLSEDVRNRIRGWILSEVPPVEFQPDGVGAREKVWRRLEMPTIGTPQSIPPQSANPDRITQMHAQVSTPTLNAAPTLFGAKTWVAARPSVVLSPRSWGGTEHRPGVEAGYGPRKALVHRRRGRTLAVVVILGAFISFLTGWFTAPGTGSRILARFGKTTLKTSETANGVESPPASSVGSVPSPSVQNAPPHRDEPEPLSSRTDGDFPGGPVSNPRAEARSKGLAPATRDTSVVSSKVQIAHPQEHALEPLPVSTAGNVLSSHAENALPAGPGIVAAQPKETSVTTPPSPNVNQPEGARTAARAEPESSLPPKPAENPEVEKASVSVSFGLYPSIRIPSGLKSQTSRQGATLQIGQLLSRVDPIYPEDAETQRIEGTVKLHAIIAQDGTIQTVEQRSGPALLIPAAADAVRQWRYTPSSVGGQPVEAEEDITITFRLLKQAAHPN